jgi:hypothetical protein
MGWLIGEGGGVWEYWADEFGWTRNRKIDENENFNHTCIVFPILAAFILQLFSLTRFMTFVRSTIE